MDNSIDVCNLEHIRQKVFIIGLHKTGTTSLICALDKLGYKCCVKARKKLLRNIVSGDWNTVFSVCNSYDAFNDSPWQNIFKELDSKYSGSKFILSIRDENKWLQSICNYFGSHKTAMRKWIYGAGCPKGNEQLYLKKYRRHNMDVQKYFAHRPNDLLVIDLSKEGDWEYLCNFLHKPIPNSVFPYRNKGRYSILPRNVKRVYEKSKQLLPDNIFLKMP